MNADEYQGWTNYETWSVKLWMDNEQRIYNAVREMVRIVGGFPEDERLYKLADAVQTYMSSEREITNATDTASFASDLLGYALQARVNWREIAENLLSEV